MKKKDKPRWKDLPFDERMDKKLKQWGLSEETRERVKQKIKKRKQLVEA